MATTEELAGYTTALLVLGVLSLVVVATNAFALLFLLPSLHAWLWLPQLRDRRAAIRAAVLAAGLAGPALVLGSFAVRYGVGLDAPWYLATLAALGLHRRRVRRHLSRVAGGSGPAHRARRPALRAVPVRRRAAAARAASGTWSAASCSPHAPRGAVA